MEKFSGQKGETIGDTRPSTEHMCGGDGKKNMFSRRLSTKRKKREEALCVFFAIVCVFFVSFFLLRARLTSRQGGALFVPTSVERKNLHSRFFLSSRC